MLAKTSIIRTFGVVLVTAFAAVTLAPTAVLASTTGRRNTAIGLTAGAIYSAVKGKKTAAIALGAGAAYAWKRHADSRVNAAYKKGYRAGKHHRHHRYHKCYRH